MVKTILMIKSEYLKYLRRHEEVGKPIVDKIGKLNKFYIPLSEWIYSIYNKDKKIKIIGLSGGQGAGKSTITGILKIILKKKYNLNLCCFSIDDFYKTKAERLKMAKKVHPLFLTRGVPGTHDVALINKTIKKLKKKPFNPVLVPKFDKSNDDRHKRSRWQKIKVQPNIIIFEGWCLGTNSQKQKQIKKPLNKIEEVYDFNLIWRSAVNTYLKNQYKNLFDKIDKLIYLKAPSFKWIFKWRLLQEQKMKLTSKTKRIMSKTELKDFIMFYERITKQMMKDHSIFSDLTVFLDTKHRSKKIKLN